MDERVELLRFRGLFFSGDFLSDRSWTTSLSSLAGISRRLVSTYKKGAVSARSKNNRRNGGFCVCFLAVNWCEFNEFVSGLGGFFVEVL